MEHVLTVQPQELLRFPTRVMKSGRLTVVGREKWMAKKNQPKSTKTFTTCTAIVGGWTNPSEKYKRQNGFILPNFRGENSKKYGKPPPTSRNSFIGFFIKAWEEPTKSVRIPFGGWVYHTKALNWTGVFTNPWTPQPWSTWRLIVNPYWNLGHKNPPKNDWLVVSTHLKNISQNGNIPQIGMKIKNIETTS